MASDNEECVNLVVQASTSENRAIQLDRAHKVQEAIAAYEESEKMLDHAIRAAGPGQLQDKPKLEQHKREIHDRITHLRSLRSGEVATIPVEQQIKAVQLTMQATAAAQQATRSAGGVKTLAGAAVLGGVGGFCVLGGAIGVVGGAAAVAYVATRQDAAGNVARKAGDAVVSGGKKAQQLNEEHQITGKICDVGSAAAQRAKEVNSTYKISDRISVGVSTCVGMAKDIDEKHNVTDKVAHGFSKGLTKVSAALSGSSGSSGSKP